MSYRNRYDTESNRIGYEYAKNYDHDIFNAEYTSPQLRHNNFKKCRQVSTEVAEKRIDNKIRVNNFN